MTFTESIKSCFDNYATFSGRAPRSEYWFFVLFNMLVVWGVILVFSALGYAVGGAEGAGIAYGIGYVICILGLFLPSLAVLVRRLHDTGRSGWWYFIAFVPVIGGIWLLVLMCTGSDDENQYGLPVY